MPSGIRPVKSAAHQPSRPTTQTTPCKAPREHERGTASKSRNSVTSRRWRCGGVDRELDRIAAGRADEARERAADDEQECADVHRVAHPGREKAVERPRHAPVTSATSHATTAARSASTLHSRSQIRCGIASRSRKKTVSRERSTRVGRARAAPGAAAASRAGSTRPGRSSGSDR